MTPEPIRPQKVERRSSVPLGAFLGGVLGALFGLAIGAIVAPPEPANPEVQTAFCGILGIAQRVMVGLAILMGLSIGVPTGCIIGVLLAVWTDKARLAREGAQSAAMMSPDPTGIEFPDSKGPAP